MMSTMNSSNNLVAVPRKLGFTHEGTLREKTPFLERWSDSMVWGMLESEYPSSPAAKTEVSARRGSLTPPRP